MCRVLGHLAPVHRCARSVCCVTCVWCPGPLGSYSPVGSPAAFCCVSGVVGLLAPVHRCGCSVRCLACAVSCATWLPFTVVLALCVVLCVRCPGPLGSCSPVRPLAVLCRLCGVLGHLAPVQRCARSVRCFACAVSWATSVLFTGVLARCAVLRVQCAGPVGSCLPVCSPGALCCVGSILGPLAPLARCVVWHVRCLGPLGSCSPMCLLRASCCVCGVLSHLAPVHRCARSVRCVACAVFWATWLLFTCVLPRCVVLHYLCGVLSHLAPVYRCACSVCCVTCVVSWATWLLFTGVLARCVVSRVRCLGPLGSYSPMCPLPAWCCVCGVLGHLAPVHLCVRSVCYVALRDGALGHLAPVHRGACSVCCVTYVVSWATWLLFDSVPGVRARCVASLAWCPGPLGSSSPVCSPAVICCVCGVLGHLAPVHRCASSVRCLACAVSWATWLLFTGVLAPCVALRVR